LLTTEISGVITNLKIQLAYFYELSSSATMKYRQKTFARLSVHALSDRVLSVRLSLCPSVRPRVRRLSVVTASSTFTNFNKMLSYRRETALQGTLVLARSGRLEVRDNILRTL